MDKRFNQMFANFTIGHIPVTSMRFEAMLCWMDESASLKIDSPYYIRHTPREV